jgi:hypothetical protein
MAPASFLHPPRLLSVIPSAVEGLPRSDAPGLLLTQRPCWSRFLLKEQLSASFNFGPEPFRLPMRLEEVGRRLHLGRARPIDINTTARGPLGMPPAVVRRHDVTAGLRIYGEVMVGRHIRVDASISFGHADGTSPKRRIGPQVLFAAGFASVWSDRS